VVLEPLVGALNFTFGLGGQGVDDATVGQDLFPLWVNLIGDFVLISPDGIAALDKAEDGMGIDVIGKR
jgi:hypothetical protein